MDQLAQQDFLEALRLFTEVVDAPAASPSLKGAARNHRATICAINGAAIAAANEWGLVLATEGLSAEDYAAAHDGLSHLAGVAEQPAGTVTPEALHQHGLFHLKVEEFGVAIAAFTLVVHDPRASGDQRANALSHRGFTHLKADNAINAASDWSRVPEIAGASEMTLLLARRGLERIAGGRALRTAEEQWKAGDIPAAIATYQSVMESTGGNGMDQFVAAGALLMLQGVPQAIRAQAEQLRADAQFSPPQIHVERFVRPAGQRSGLRNRAPAPFGAGHDSWGRAVFADCDRGISGNRGLERSRRTAVCGGCHRVSRRCRQRAEVLVRRRHSAAASV